MPVDGAHPTLYLLRRAAARLRRLGTSFGTEGTEASSSLPDLGVWGLDEGWRPALCQASSSWNARPRRRVIGCRLYLAMSTRGLAEWDSRNPAAQTAEVLGRWMMSELPAVFRTSARPGRSCTTRRSSMIVRSMLSRATKGARARAAPSSLASGCCILPFPRMQRADDMRSWGRPRPVPSFKKKKSSTGLLSRLNSPPWILRPTACDAASHHDSRHPLSLSYLPSPCQISLSSIPIASFSRISFRNASNGGRDLTTRSRGGTFRNRRPRTAPGPSAPRRRRRRP